MNTLNLSLQGDINQHQLIKIAILYDFPYTFVSFSSMHAYYWTCDIDLMYTVIYLSYNFDCIE